MTRSEDEVWRISSIEEADTSTGVSDRLSRIWRTAIGQRILVACTLAAAAIFILLAYNYGWQWTGFVKRKLWDWLDLLIIPLALGIGTLWLSTVQRQQELRDADRQRSLEMDIQDQRAKDDALQSYIDYMSKVLLDDKLLEPYMEPPQGEQIAKRTEVEHAGEYNDAFTYQWQAVLRARTLGVLARLGDDSWRKISVLQFLGEAGLITKHNVEESTAVPLAGADLRGIYFGFVATPLDYTDFSNASLDEANLAGASLVNTFFIGAILNDAHLEHADLTGAYFIDAKLSGAHLKNADLTGADLTGAVLVQADLTNVNLADADLSRANLLWAKGLTTEQIDACKSLEGATMPDHKKYEEWLKDRRDGGKVGQSGGA